MQKYSANQIPEVTSSSLETPRQREIYHYLLHNNGPDNDRRAHPTLSKVDYKDLMPALNAAQQGGYCDGIKPYHFQIVRGIWKESRWVDEIVLKQVASIMESKYSWDFLEFCAGVQAKDLLKPLSDTVGARCFTISVAQPLGDVCSSSPYLIAMRYLEITGQQEKYGELRRFHFNTASQGTFHDGNAAVEVVKRKIQNLLKEVYNHDFAKLCAQTTQEEFMAPFLDPVAGRRMLVSVGTAAAHFDYSIYKMLHSYIKSENLKKEYQYLRPYHLSTAANGVYNDENIVREVLIKSCKFQIATRYKGNEEEFLRKSTIPQLCEDFYETIQGVRFRVVTASAIDRFGESSKRIKQLYLKFRDSYELLL
jgi:hypothetical protein